MIRLIARAALLGTIGLLISACAAPEPSLYQNEKPVFDLKNYFNGTIDGWGIVQDRSGKVTKRFHVVMNCTWMNDDGVLDESFEFSDGTKQRRTWNVKKKGNDYTGTADDLKGQAEGEAA